MSGNQKHKNDKSPKKENTRMEEEEDTSQQIEDVKFSGLDSKFFEKSLF